MGNPKQRWTAEEEEALKAGVAKYGAGRWRNILVDSEFAPILFKRSNIDLKDKWRNWGDRYGQDCKDSSTAFKAETSVSSVVAPKIQRNSRVLRLKEKADDHAPRSPQDAKNVSKQLFSYAICLPEKLERKEKKREMRNPKQKWTAEEEEALKAGVAKHGAGMWKNILTDSEFAPKLFNRSNAGLKDKWRNLGVSYGQGCKDSSTTSNAETYAPKIPRNSPVLYLKEKADDHPRRTPQNAKNVPKYNTMILEALSSLKDPNGSDIGAIVRFIERKYEVPQNFRRLLSSKLRRLVLQEKLEKVAQCYKIKDVALGTRTPSPKQKDVRPKPLQQYSLMISGESKIVEDAAKTAAKWIAEADYKAFLMSEALEESEMVSQMAEDADAMLILAEELYVKCSGDEYILVY